MKKKNTVPCFILPKIFRWMLVCIVSLMVSTTAEAAITIDGNFSDWSPSDLLGTDTSGDVSSGDMVDWTAMWARSEAGNLCLSYETAGAIDFAANAWRYGIYIDADNNASTGFHGTGGDLHIGAEYLIEGRNIMPYLGDGRSWEWGGPTAVDHAVSGNRLEMSLPESDLGLAGNYTISILLYGSNPGRVDCLNDDKSGSEYTAVR